MKDAPVTPSVNVSEDVAIAGRNPGAAHFESDQKPGDPKPLYSAMAQLNTNNSGNFIVDSDGFIVVVPNGKPLKSVSNINQRRNSQIKQRNPSQGMVGNATRSGIEAATRIVKASVFVSRYPPQTTEEEVKTDLMLDPRVKELDIHVEAVKTKYDTYTSLHVTCVKVCI